MQLLALAAAAAVAAAWTPPAYNTAGVRVPNKLNVHLVPHTHDDVGWLKTVDQYYYGRNSSIQYAAVANILDSTVAELQRNPDRKFTYVETEFFRRWWQNRPQYQAAVKQLVASGQLEFINGGGCMHDEANPSYVDMIDQTTSGHRFLKETFGVAPKTTWQIDPFGHSAFQASVMSAPAAGFNAVFYARADYQEFAMRQATNSTEYFWMPSPSLGENGATLGGILGFYYYPAPGFNFAPGSNDDPVCDDPTLEEYNVQDRVNDFVNVAMQQWNFTLGNDVMWTQGTDFSYENAAYWYENMDRLVHYVNLDGRVNALYSTPSIYASAKIGYGKANPLPVKSDDMFPLIDGPHSVWAGYFTSRSALKAYIRDTSALQVALRQMQTVTGGANTTEPPNPLNFLERSMAVLQHHDAVSGTAKQHVTYDYAKRLAEGRSQAAIVATSALQTLTGDASANFVGCDLANATICPALESTTKTTIVNVWNSQSYSRSNVLVTLPIAQPRSGSWAVYDSTGKPVTAQVVPLTATDVYLRTVYYGYNDNPTEHLVFTATLPAVGYATYFVAPAASDEEAPFTFRSEVRTMVVGSKAGTGMPEEFTERIHEEASHTATGAMHHGSKRTGLRSSAVVGDQTITNGLVTVTISSATGLVSAVARNGSVPVALSQTFAWYNASDGQQGDNAPQADQASGAYIFRPNASTVFPVATSGVVAVTLVTGPVVSEARQTFANWCTQNVRIWSGSSYVDFAWTIGPIPIADAMGKEVISLYTTPLKTNATWYSDSNIRDTMKRVRNYRPSFTINITEPVAANYVPVNGFAYIQDVNTGTTVSVVTDRSQGCTSMVDGQLEIMVQRRLLVDDNRGVGEPLNETGLTYGDNGLVVRGMHRISVDATPAAAGVSRRTAVGDMVFRPVANYAPLTSAASPSAWIASHKASYSGLTADLPANVQLLTAQSVGTNQLLVRLSHNYEAGEGGNMANAATVSLANLFSGFKITAATEMTLTANNELTAAPQSTYVTQDGRTVTLPIINAAPSGADLSVTLTPMLIRTFLCTTTQTA